MRVHIRTRLETSPTVRGVSVSETSKREKGASERGSATKLFFFRNRFFKAPLRFFPFPSSKTPRNSCHRCQRNNDGTHRGQNGAALESVTPTQLFSLLPYAFHRRCCSRTAAATATDAATAAAAAAGLRQKCSLLAAADDDEKEDTSCAKALRAPQPWPAAHRHRRKTAAMGSRSSRGHLTSCCCCCCARGLARVGSTLYPGPSILRPKPYFQKMFVRWGLFAVCKNTAEKKQDITCAKQREQPSRNRERACVL